MPNSVKLPVRVNNKYGYINRQGEVVIPTQFDSAFAFKAGLARVVNGSQDVYVDTTGQIVFELPGLYGQLLTGLWPDATVVFELDFFGAICEDGSLDMKWWWRVGASQ